MSKIRHPARVHASLKEGRLKIKSIQAMSEVTIAIGYFYPEASNYPASVQAVVDFVLGNNDVCIDECKMALMDAQAYRLCERDIERLTYEVMHESPRSTFEDAFRQALIDYGVEHIPSKMRVQMDLFGNVGYYNSLDLLTED